MYKIHWSDEAKADLKEIYNFIKKKSPQGAKNVISDIRKAPKTIYFSKQYSIEEYFPVCRKIVVRNYKIIHTVNTESKTINIISIFDTRQNPDKLSSKNKPNL